MSDDYEDQHRCPSCELQIVWPGEECDGCGSIRDDA